MHAYVLSVWFSDDRGILWRLIHYGADLLFEWETRVKLLFFTSFQNFALRVCVRAGKLESMCQHVVCFSFEAACRCSNEISMCDPTHIYTNTNQYTRIFSVCFQYTQVNYVFVYVWLVVVSVVQTSWMVTHTQPSKQNTLTTNERKRKKQLDRHRFDGVRSIAFPCVNCREILFQCETQHCVLLMR